MVATVAATSKVIFGQGRAQTGGIQQFDKGRLENSGMAVVRIAVGPRPSALLDYQETWCLESFESLGSPSKTVPQMVFLD